MAVSNYAGKELTMASLKEHVFSPPVQMSHSALGKATKVFARVKEAGDLFTDEKTMKAMTQTFPKIAGKLVKVGGLAKALGPAGLAVGVASDLLAATGLVPSEHDEIMKKLDEISKKMDDLRVEMTGGFQRLGALQRFADTYSTLLAIVTQYERDVVGSTSFYETLGKFVAENSPSKIFSLLWRLHNAIIGEDDTEGGVPVFKALLKAGQHRKGDDFDELIATLKFQFEKLHALQLRVARMVRSLVSYQREDVVHGKALENIFYNLAEQQEKHNPTQFYEQYLKLKCWGGRFNLRAAYYPNRRVMYTYGRATPKGSTGDDTEDPKFVFEFTPRGNNTYAIMAWGTNSYRYMYMHNPFGVTRAVVALDTDDIGPTDEAANWKLSMEKFDMEISQCQFTLTNVKWPDWYMYMGYYMYGYAIMGWEGDPGDKAHFTLTHVGSVRETPDPPAPLPSFMNIRFPVGGYT